jgi:MFS transporter, DHA1 family, inner membrane transport protein
VPQSVAAPGIASSLRPVGALAALCAAAFCYVTGESLPIGLLPVLSASLHSSLSATGLLVTIYAMVVVVGSVPLTRLTQRLPRRTLLSSLTGTFAVSTLAGAAAPSYGWLVTMRAITALSQAVFWSAAPAAAAGLFPPARRGQAVAGVLGGGSLAVVLGVPAGTWLGQQAGWRLPFTVLAGLGLAAATATALLIPSTGPGESHAATGPHPDARRYRLLVIATVLAVGGTLAAYTFVSPFLVQVSGLTTGDVAPVLLLGGVASLAAVVCTGLVVNRNLQLATIGPPALLAMSLLGFAAFGTISLVATVLQMVESFAMSGLAISMQTRILIVAPRSTDIASAWFATSYNGGIALGPLIGGLALSGLGLRGTPLVGGILAVAAVSVVLYESLAPGNRPPECARHSAVT